MGVSTRMSGEFRENRKMKVCVCLDQQKTLCG